MKTNEECPGEHVCITSGVCYMHKTTIERHCKRDKCSLWFTKPANVPYQYGALLETAIRLKERELNSLPIEESDLLYFEILAYTIFNRSERIAQRKRDEENQDDEAPKGQPGRGFSPGNSTAFQFSEEQLRQMYEDRARATEKRNKRSPRRAR